MTKQTRIAIIVAGSLIIVVMGYFYFLTRCMRSERSCEWANIDNLELHTGINIPKVISSDCDYITSRNVKYASFALSRDDVQFAYYIKNNNLEKLVLSDTSKFDSLFKVKAGFMLSGHGQQSLFYKIGDSQEAKWQLLLDSSNAKLWIMIKYTDD